VGLLATDSALRRVERRVSRWSATVPEDHQAAALRLRATLEMVRRDLTAAVAAISELRAAGYTPAPAAPDEPPAFAVGQHVRIVGAANLKRFSFLGTAIDHLYVSAVHPFGMVSVRVGGDHPHHLGVLQSSWLEAVDDLPEGETR
jgi:hypothetical protein